LTATETAATPRHTTSGRPRRLWLGSVWAVVAVLALAIVIRGFLAGLITAPRPAAVATVFLSVLLEALPFLFLGVLASALVRELVAPGLLKRWLRARGLFARPYALVPMAAVAAVIPTDTDDARTGPTAAGFAYALAAVGPGTTCARRSSGPAVCWPSARSRPHCSRWPPRSA
jgi:hypothetical protein